MVRARARLRSQSFSITYVIVAILGLFIAGVVAMNVTSRASTEPRLLAAMRATMDNVATTTVDLSEAYLDDGRSSVELLAALIEDGIAASPEDYERIFYEQLRVSPDLAGIFLGTENGEFHYVSRSEEHSTAGYRTKSIEYGVDGRRVEFVWRDRDFREVETGVDPDDTYEPRERPWYLAAVEADATIWTDPYVFFSAQVPGITTAVPVHGPGGNVVGVVGVDIELGALSGFLGDLDIGAQGTAFITNPDGEVVAFPDPDVVYRPTDDGTGLRLSTLGELDRPEPAAALRALTSESGLDDTASSQFVSFDLGSDTHYAVFSPLGSNDWVLGVQVHEDDFVGGLRQVQGRNYAVAASISLLIVFLGAGLARNIIRPLRLLRARAVEIERGNFVDGDPIETSLSEIRQTSDAFDYMVDGLVRQRTENQRLLDELEDRVERRTAALRREVAEREQAEAAAHAANEAKSLFLANVSHEIRTPLNAVLGLSELIAAEVYGPVGDPRYLEYANDINTSGDHLLELINDVIDMSQVQADRLTLIDDVVDIGELVAGVTRMLSLAANERDLTVAEEVPVHLPRITADERRLRQVLINLVGNAIKFTPARGTVSISAELIDGCVRIVVRDTGVGMDEAGIAVALSEFGQVGGSLTGELGSGLGLPLSKRLVEAHGASFEVSSIPGVGTTIGLTFPSTRTVFADAA